MFTFLQSRKYPLRFLFRQIEQRHYFNMRRASRVKRCNGRCTAVTDAEPHFNLFSRCWKLGSLIVAIHCLVPLGCRTFLDFPPSLLSVLRSSSPDTAAFSCVFTPRYLLQSSIRLFSSPTLAFLALLCTLHLGTVVALVQQTLH